MIERLVPATVAVETTVRAPVASRPTDAALLPGEALFPEEAALMATAVAKRRRDFTEARLCARRALARLGIDPVPILPGPRGEPRWPPGVVGSITHCTGFVAAAVASHRDVRALGIDAEPNQLLPPGVREAVALPGERAALAQLAGTRPRIAWDRLLFSAKESVFKAWFPLTGEVLDFTDATVDLQDGGRFGVVLRGGVTLAGRWCLDRGVIATALVVLADSTAAGDGPLAST